MKEFIGKLISRVEEVSIPIFDEHTEMESKVIFTDIAKNIVNQLEEEHKDAEEQGLLLRLPCKIGSTVWFVGNDFVNDYEVIRYVVDKTGVHYVQVASVIDGREYWSSFSIDEIGKTVFLTREQAEQALAEMKGV